MFTTSLGLAALFSALTASLPTNEPTVPQDAAAEPITREDYLRDLYARLDEHPFFGFVDNTRVDDFVEDGFVFIIQRPLKDRPDYAKDQAALYSPWFKELVAILQREYVEPLGLVDNHSLPLSAVAFLSSRGDYEVNFADASNKDLNATRAHYDPANRMVITYRDVMTGTGPRSDRLPALHELVHALQHRYSATPDKLPECVFFNEGLAEYLSNHLLDEPADLGKHRLDFLWIKDFAPVFLTSARDGYFLPIDTLVGIKDYAELLDIVKKRCDRSGIPFSWEFAMQSFYRESALYMHFLHQGKNGEYKSRTGTFIQALFAGKSGAEAWKAGFKGVDSGQVDRDFYEYFAKTVETEYPSFNSADFVQSIASAIQVSAPATPALDCDMLAASLALGTEDVEARVARALCTAMSGKVAAALADLEQCKSSATGALAERVVTETARLEAWVGACDAALAAMAAGKQAIAIKLDGKTIRGVVRGVENGELVIEGASNSLRRVALETLSAVELRDALKDRFVGDLEWLKVYPLCVTGDAKWKKLSLPSTPEGRALKEDAESTYPMLEPLGIAAVALQDVEQRAAPTSADEARNCVAAIQALWETHKTVPLIAARSATLAQLACCMYDVIGESLDVGALVHVPVTKLENGRIALKYSFDSEDEASDFVVCDEYLAGLRREDPAVGDSGSPFAVAAHQFRGQGAQCSKHVLDFTAPMTLRYTMRWELGDTNLPDAAWDARAGLCGDAYENALVFSIPQFLFLVKNGAYEDAAQLRSPREFHLDGTYHVELHHDGSKLSVNVGGQNVGSLSTASQTAGRIFFWIHSDYPVSISDVEIEGQLEDSSLSAARHAWAMLQSEALGIR